MTGRPLTIPVDLTEDQAWALAQLVKRFGYEDACRLANAYDGGRERDLMIDAVCKLQRSLSKAGFSPR